MSVNIVVSSFVLGTHPALRATRRSRAATTEAEVVQMGSATADNNSPVLLKLAMSLEAG